MLSGYLSKKNFHTNNLKFFVSNILGNIAGHYDTALYGLLAPILSSVFLPHLEGTKALMITYSLLAISLFSAPIGIYIFGNLVIKYGPKYTLAIALCGVGGMMVCIGILPGYYTIGIYAPLLLILTRFFLEIFATGENIVAGMYMIETTRSSYRGRVTGLFQSSTVIGIIMASSVSAVIYNSDHPELYWRWAFIAGMLVALPGMYIRIQDIAGKVPYRQSIYTISEVVHLLYQEKFKVLKVIALSGFSYLPYVIPFVFFNNFVPRITDISQSDMIYVNTVLLYVDMILFPIIGYHADKLPPKKNDDYCLFISDGYCGPGIFDFTSF